MTEQEQIVLKQFRDDFLIMRNDVARIKRGMRAFRRIERGMMGDITLGDPGLFMKLDAALKRIADLETEVVELRRTNGAISRLVDKGPALLFGASIFLVASGGNLGAMLQFIAGVLK